MVPSAPRPDVNGQRRMETGRECERRRGGQSQTRRWQTKAAREKEGKDVQWEGEGVSNVSDLGLRNMKPKRPNV